MAVIYQIKCLKNGKTYIGQTKRLFKSRMQEHIRSLNGGTHQNDRLQADWKKYGIENFSFSVVEECPQFFLDWRERHWIKYRGEYNDIHGKLYSPWNRVKSFAINALAVLLLGGVVKLFQPQIQRYLLAYYNSTVQEWVNNE